MATFQSQPEFPLLGELLIWEKELTCGVIKGNCSLDYQVQSFTMVRFYSESRIEFSGKQLALNQYHTCVLLTRWPGHLGDIWTWTLPAQTPVFSVWYTWNPDSGFSELKTPEFVQIGTPGNLIGPAWDLVLSSLQHLVLSSWTSVTRWHLVVKGPTMKEVWKKHRLRDTVWYTSIWHASACDTRCRWKVPHIFPASGPATYQLVSFKWQLWYALSGGDLTGDRW